MSSKDKQMKSINRIIFSGEYVFLVYEKVKKPDVSIWGSENIDKISKNFRNSKKITVWYALLVDCVIGSYYFEDLDLFGKGYLHLLNNYYLPTLSTLFCLQILSRGTTKPLHVIDKLHKIY